MNIPPKMNILITYADVKVSLNFLSMILIVLANDERVVSGGNCIKEA